MERICQAMFGYVIKREIKLRNLKKGSALNYVATTI